MSAPIPAYFLEETGRERLWLRRYAHSDKSVCGTSGYHNAKNYLTEADIVWATTTGDTRERVIAAREHSPLKPPNDDPRWPTKCEKCDYQFTAEDPFQLFGARLFRRQDTNELWTIDDAPIGALWYADWMSSKGPDGHCLMAKIPGGHLWCIDGRASNCDMKADNAHRCWVRHGTPPNINVDKNGLTCNAGGGSIQVPAWHGFLRNGQFVEC